MEKFNGQLLIRLIASLLAGGLIAVALHFAFSFTWLQSCVLTWLYCLLKSEIETIEKAIKR